jgi:hypothetical protein
MGKIRGEIGGEITGTVGDVTITTWKGIKVAKRRRGSFYCPTIAGANSTAKTFPFGVHLCQRGRCGQAETGAL